MKTLIIALNSKYIHSALAPWYLKASCSDVCGEVKVMEFTINENPDSVLAAIYAEKADVAAFSCYIWNIGQILRITENLKKVQPQIITVFGGPEVSYDAADLLQKYSFLDYVISGEGEKAFPSLLKCINLSEDYGAHPPIVENNTLAAIVRNSLREIAGLTYRSGGAFESNPMNPPLDLSEIPSPYTKNMLAAVKDKIVYFEASRGCPFSCSYCLSSTVEGVRFFPLERVKEDLAAVIKAGVRQVKFVDRTFNCNKQRAKDIQRFIAELQMPDDKVHTDCNGYADGINHKDSTPASTNFHFEAAADLFDDELLQILAEIPKGLVQLEIGIQTTNTYTLEAVKRKTDIDKVFRNISSIMKAGNIHLHLDLIAGLPYEDFNSFKESFNRVYSLKPHTLQLGFLKLLKGSYIRENSEQHAYIFRDYAPYEVLSSKYISFDELTILKGIEEILDRYWNSGKFTFSLDYLINNYFSSAFDFYLGFYNFNTKANRNIQSISGRDLVFLLQEYAESAGGIDTARFKEYLKLDFLASDNSGHLPAGLDRISPDGFNDKCFEFLKLQSNLTTYLPAFTEIPSKQIMKKVHFELILIDACEKTINNKNKPASVYLFDYTAKDAVTGRYRYCIINNF